MESAVKTFQLAIIGAGVSGLAAALSLHAIKDIKVTIFEKSKDFSGRAATQKKDNFIWDFGANYFSTDNPELIDFVLKKLPVDDLIEIKKPINVFNLEGIITPGDPIYNKKSKWNYKSGISNIGRLMYELCDKKVECKRSLSIGKLSSEKNSESSTGHKWRLYSSEKEDLGIYDAVLLTPPSPEIISIIKASDFSEDLQTTQQEIIKGLESAEYNTQITVALAYKTRISDSLEYYALINSDRKHDIAWLSVEDDKLGHVPEGNSLIIVQMAASWTKNSWNKSSDEIALEVREKAEELLQVKDKLKKDDLLFSDVQRWPYALPTKVANKAALLDASKCGLFFSGDYLVGRGRVMEALETGLRAAEQIKSIYHTQPGL